MANRMEMAMIEIEKKVLSLSKKFDICLLIIGLVIILMDCFICCNSFVKLQQRPHMEKEND